MMKRNSWVLLVLFMACAGLVACGDDDDGGEGGDGGDFNRTGARAEACDHLYACELARAEELGIADEVEKDLVCVGVEMGWRIATNSADKDACVERVNRLYECIVETPCGEPTSADCRAAQEDFDAHCEIDFG